MDLTLSTQRKRHLWSQTSMISSLEWCSKVNSLTQSGEKALCFPAVAMAFSMWVPPHSALWLSSFYSLSLEQKGLWWPILLLDTAGMWPKASQELSWSFWMLIKLNGTKSGSFLGATTKKRSRVYSPWTLSVSTALWCFSQVRPCFLGFSILATNQNSSFGWAETYPSSVRTRALQFGVQKPGIFSSSRDRTVSPFAGRDWHVAVWLQVFKLCPFGYMMHVLQMALDDTRCM